MLQIETEIHRLSFSQVNIFGCYLPSRSSIESVLEQIRDHRKKRKICDRSNSQVPRLGRKYGLTIHQLEVSLSNAVLKERTGVGRSASEIYHDIGVGILYLTEKQCRISGDDYFLIVQNEFTVNWFECVVGDYGHDNQKFRKISDNILVHVYSKGAKKLTNQYFGLKPEVPTPNMAKYPDYIFSKSYGQEFNTKVWKMINSNREIFHLAMAVVELCNKSFELTEQLKNIPLELFCPNCQTYFSAKRRPSLMICPACLAKQKAKQKLSRRIDRKGWVADRRGACDGGCGSPKIRINKLDSCLKCYLSKL
jgi:hypothetical protein